MIEETGRVVAKEQPGIVWVETVRKSSCSSCASEKGCGTGVISKAMSGKRSYVKALTDIDDLQTGEEVVIGVPEDFLLRGTLKLYLFPLTLMLAAMALSNSLFHYGDGGTLLFALGGLALGVAAIRVMDYFTPLSQRDHPRVLHRGSAAFVRIC
ncbi:MAG TPA: SoxR reducing system RseC family protein, partial [Pseudomonadales bacterium]|nr:SoxR reducing system RseC family protein [Pseudomonadales bacterium]